MRADVEIVPLGSIPEDAKRLEDLRILGVHRHHLLPGALVEDELKREGARLLWLAGHPRERDARAGRAGDHRGAQRGLGGERHVVRDPRPLPPRLVSAPGADDQLIP